MTAACQCLALVADVYGINFHKIPQRKRFENIIPFIFEFVNLDTYFSGLIAFLHVLFIHYINSRAGSWLTLEKLFIISARLKQFCFCNVTFG